MKLPISQNVLLVFFITITLLILSQGCNVGYCPIQEQFHKSKATPYYQDYIEITDYYTDHRYLIHKDVKTSYWEIDHEYRGDTILYWVTPVYIIGEDTVVSKNWQVEFYTKTK